MTLKLVHPQHKDHSPVEALAKRSIGSKPRSEVELKIPSSRLSNEKSNTSLSNDKVDDNSKNRNTVEESTSDQELKTHKHTPKDMSSEQNQEQPSS